MAANLVEFAQDLKNRLSIEQVIGDVLPSLRRAGRTWKANCPFHDEKTPSFNVSPERGFYHCFGCGVSGDAIKFVMEFEKVDFRMAVETLARRYRIPIPDFEKGLPAEARDERERTKDRLMAAHLAAERFFMDQLASPAGEAARDYLAGRGLTPDQVREYRLGYAPDEWEALIRHLRGSGFAPELLVEGGLAVAREGSGRYTDRFRGRVMFPIRDGQGRVVAFGGRTLGKDERGPKYLNSADSPIFHKGRLLYGFDAAREAIREAGAAVLLEGYMDWIALHSAGVRNAVAGLGTAFGEDQARLLSRVTETVVLHYDGDAAGRKAMLRSAELLLARGLDVRVAALPDGHDPDSFVRERGLGATRELIAGAEKAIDHFTTDALARFPFASPEGKAAIVDHLAPLLLAISDPVLRAGYVQRTAARVGLDAATFERGLAARRKRGHDLPSASPSHAGTGRPREGPGRSRAALVRPPAGVPSAFEGAPPGEAPLPPDPEEGGWDDWDGEGPQAGDLPEEAAPETVVVARGRLRREQFFLRLRIELLGREDLFSHEDEELFAEPALRALHDLVVQVENDMREGSEAPDDWLSLCTTPLQRELLAEILFLENFLAGGELAPLAGALAPPPSEDAAGSAGRETELLHLLDDLRHLLGRQNSVRRRRALRARIGGGAHEVHVETGRAIHDEGVEAIRRHEERGR